jgi:hypothetical protein
LNINRFDHPWKHSYPVDHTVNYAVNDTHGLFTDYRADHAVYFAVYFAVYLAVYYAVYYAVVFSVHNRPNHLKRRTDFYCHARTDNKPRAFHLPSAQRKLSESERLRQLLRLRGRSSNFNCKFGTFHVS